MKATLSIYEQQLADLPADDVRSVIQKFGRGIFGDGHWAPTTAEIRREVEKLVSARIDAQRRERDLEKQLAERRSWHDRQQRQDERCRERVLGLVEEFKGQLPEDSANPKGWRPPTRAEAEAWVAAHEGGQGVRPVTEFSPSLIEKLREMRMADDERFSEIDAWARETIG